MTYRFSNQITGCLLAVVTVLGLTPVVSFASTPPGHSLPQVAGNQRRCSADLLDSE